MPRLTTLELGSSLFSFVRRNLESRHLAAHAIDLHVAQTTPSATRALALYTDNDIGLEGTRSLAAVLPQSRMEVLSPKCNGLGMDSACVLAIVLPSTQLTGLDLHSTCRVLAVAIRLQTDLRALFFFCLFKETSSARVTMRCSNRSCRSRS